jgi:hypothetical protein
MNKWVIYLKKHKGSGLSMTQLAAQYKSHPMIGGRFMCCQSLSEEQAVRQYIETHMKELITKLSPAGVHYIIVEKSKTREGTLGRFIISFGDEKMRELCHLTLVCDSGHWSEKINKREPHFTIGSHNYYYTYDALHGTLTYRDAHKNTSPIHSDIVKVVEEMLNRISSTACIKPPPTPVNQWSKPFHPQPFNFSS